MVSRVRFLAGIFALAAMLLSLAEGGWASVCSPTMAMGACETSEATAMDDTTGTAQAPAGDCMRHGSAGTRDDGAPGPEHCPFMPMTGWACALAVSLPADATLYVAPLPEGAALLPCYETLPEILLGRALFHPPKA